MKIKVIQVEYDTDGENLNLPQEMIFDLPDDIVDQIDEFVSDKISSETGFCHNGFITNLDEQTNKVVYTAESGKTYTFDEVLKLAQGDVKYAKKLIDVAEWQHIETLIDEDKNEIKNNLK